MHRLRTKFLAVAVLSSSTTVLLADRLVGDAGNRSDSDSAESQEIGPQPDAQDSNGSTRAVHRRPTRGAVRPMQGPTTSAGIGSAAPGTAEELESLQLARAIAENPGHDGRDFRPGVWSPQDGNAIDTGRLRLRPQANSTGRPAPDVIAPSPLPTAAPQETTHGSKEERPSNTYLIDSMSTSGAAIDGPVIPRPPKPPGPGAPHGAPEIDPNLWTAGALLLVGGSLVITGRKRAV